MDIAWVEGQDALSTLPDGHLLPELAAALDFAGPHQPLPFGAGTKPAGDVACEAGSPGTPIPAPHPQHPALKHTEHPPPGEWFIVNLEEE